MILYKLPLKTRQLALVVIAAIGILAVVAVSLFFLYSIMLEDRMNKTRNVVEVVESMVAAFESEVKAGNLTEKEAKLHVLQALKKMRYNSQEYFWVNDLQPVMIMHPIKPALDGKNLSGVKDPSGKALFMEMVDVAKSPEGQGFVHYIWPKPGSTSDVPKISYVKLFKPWGWIIGSGIYVDDIRTAVLKNALALGGMAIVILFVVLATALIITRSIVQPLESFAQSLIKLGENVSRSLSISTDATGSLAAASEETSAQSSLINSNAQQATQQVEQVYTAMEELDTSIADISANVSEVNDFVNQTVQRTSETEAVVSELTDMTEKITEVVTLITTLADQTNLLALNAAIEAARAGDAGKGFAVVADEVKKLATNTSSATGQIGENVDNIRRVADNCAKSLREVISSVQKIQENTTAMSAAVEEQSSVVKNVTVNMRTTSEQVGSVTENIKGVEQAMTESAQATQGLVDNVGELNNAFESMHKDAMQTFKTLGLATENT